MTIDFRIIEPVRSVPALLDLARLVASVRGPRRVAVAAAGDAHVLAAVHEARLENLIRPILFGDPAAITAAAHEVGLDLGRADVRPAANNDEAAELAVRSVTSGEADILMKGLLDTAVLLRAVLNKDWGLRAGKLLSHVLVYDVPGADFGRLFFMSDGAMNIEPDLKAKITIVENAVAVAHALGIPQPNVAMLAAVEVVNPDMSTAVDDAIISKMGDRGQIKGASIDGPLALDNAVSLEAARIKKIASPVAGRADVLIVDDIDVGNVFYKTLVYFARARVAGVIMGARAPIVLTSRADSEEAKFNSLALACVLSERLPLV
ncbi:bifunctional enoyl-CoA hydratase/phosphate acetyltransferase [Deinococcus peraridilitoris]|uniref:Phosphotransacetylase n=1 Tax=Deinococcus peraridilitoris (strain DSM 19664 / LMG 22246 / CIP 109416 / KR-200) TaxID=937777 RepID=K9ZWA9_DEIPD|nr:bifunctional enoyl-CoA hydratase/phosphate acetyltransferase [Deinococcus peraridilitoris]AFZ65928.1 phosphotransacetylase [Deinococcus peraridilitoris DSM 19664]